MADLQPAHSKRARLWVFDHVAFAAERTGDFLSGPWYRLSRWATERWREERP